MRVSDCVARSLCLQDLSLGRLDCTPDPIFTPTTYTAQDLADVMPGQVLELARLAGQQLPPDLRDELVGLQVVMKPIAVHAMILAVFASLVAPFGEVGCGVTLGDDCQLVARCQSEVWGVHAHAVLQGGLLLLLLGP